jgi:hypothetical protein
VFPVEDPKFPGLVPISPEIPDFPITPTVIPNPDNEPDEDDDKQKTPGVIVQVPETGQQIVFTPTGVQISRYRSPATEPYEVPKILPPPGSAPPALQDCPCPEPEDKSEEIICRIKTLQKELLDDGFTLDLRTQGPSQCLSANGFNKEFRFLEVTATVVPGNAKRISYPAPGVDSVFIGNIQFEVKGALTEPIPIRTTSQIAVAPLESTGYVVSGAFGFEVRAAAYLYTKKDYVDTCGS